MGNSVAVNDAGVIILLSSFPNVGQNAFEEVWIYDRGTAESGNFGVSKYLPVDLPSQCWTEGFLALCLFGYTKTSHPFSKIGDEW